MTDIRHVSTYFRFKYSFIIYKDYRINDIVLWKILQKLFLICIDKMHFVNHMYNKHFVIGLDNSEKKVVENSA